MCGPTELIAAGVTAANTGQNLWAAREANKASEANASAIGRQLMDSYGENLIAKSGRAADTARRNFLTLQQKEEGLSYLNVAFGAGADGGDTIAKGARRKFLNDFLDVEWTAERIPLEEERKFKEETSLAFNQAKSAIASLPTVGMGEQVFGVATQVAKGVSWAYTTKAGLEAPSNKSLGDGYVYDPLSRHV